MHGMKRLNGKTAVIASSDSRFVTASEVAGAGGRAQL
jgi:hypothetical protein